MNKPRYFIAVFGDPQPNKDPVDSGVYTPDPKYAPFPAKAGDVMLLYCTASYTAYPMQVPGIGVVLAVDRDHIEHRWIPFAQPIKKSIFGANLDPGDAAKMRDIRFSSRWLFEISQQSFSKTVGDQVTAWGKL